jgi:hypothetical protein
MIRDCGLIGECRRHARWLALAVAALWSIAAPARTPPVSNPVFLNIGMMCRWEARCMKLQEGRMRHSLRYVRKSQPPTWKVQLCNRNAARRYGRVDWVGFHNCIRNSSLRPQRPVARTQRPKRQPAAGIAAGTGAPARQERRVLFERG